MKARIPSKTGKILVIEDDPASRLLLETLLNGAGHKQVYLAEDGRQAVEICESEDIDLILLDLMLPKTSGDEVFAKLQEGHPTIPVIVITASNSVADSVKMMRLGVFDYITKPVQEEYLLPLVDGALHYRSLYKPAASANKDHKDTRIIFVGSNVNTAATLQEHLDSSFELLAFKNIETLQATLPAPEALAVIVEAGKGVSLSELDTLKYHSNSSEILIIVSKDDRELAHQSLSSGATGVLYKPIDKRTIIQKLEQIRNMYYSSRPYNHPYYAEFTQFQTQVIKSAKGTSGHTILVVSSDPGDGRTFIAANLARNIARNSDKSVLLVDFDRRKPTLHKEFILHSGQGVTEIIAGVATPEVCTYSSEYPNLHIMPAGLTKIELSHLLTHQKVSQLLAHLSGVFDTVIIDSSPLMMTNKENIDPICLADLVDDIYFVVVPRKSRKMIVKKAIDRFKTHGAPVTGIIVNNLHVRTDDGLSTKLNRLREKFLARTLTRRLFVRAGAAQYGG